jgi:NADPH-dependent curcumin reductase CurA
MRVHFFRNGRLIYPGTSIPILVCLPLVHTFIYPSLQNFEQIFKRSLTVRGFIAYTGEVLPPLATFVDDIVPLIMSGKLSAQHEHRFAGIMQAASALNAVHNGSNYGKAVIIVQDE